MKKIELYWKGPYSIEDVEENEAFEDIGVYQIYGSHPVYGSDSLLYIGHTKQKLKKRLCDEMKCEYPWWLRTGGEIRIYIGKMEKEKSDEKLIEVAEKLLIVSHMPATNASNIKNSTLDDDYHLMNFGYYNRLLPEVTSPRWFYDVE